MPAFLAHIFLFYSAHNFLCCQYKCLILYCSLSETYELKRTQHLAELQKKEEEMRQTFVIRVKEKESELKDSEKEVRVNRAGKGGTNG
jgi:hypothetical protein